MPKQYKEDHLVDEFGRVIPYDSLEGAFPKGISNEVKRATLEKNDWYRNDGSYVEGSKVKTYLDDTYGIYGETKKAGAGRKMYLGDVHAHYHKDTGIGEICTNVITDRNDLKEKPRFISARINEKQYNEYMSSSDADRIRLAAKYLPEIRLESTRDRVVEVSNIRSDVKEDGGRVIHADIDGETITRTLTPQENIRMMTMQEEKREKFFSKVFEAKGVKSKAGEKTTVSDQLDMALGQGERKEMKQLEDVAHTKASSQEKEATASQRMDGKELSMTAAVNFDQMSADASQTQQQANNMKR